ncbi:MAG: 7-cyano-7-deazaguanine synthase [Vicinamibacterales bacterium]
MSTKYSAVLFSGGLDSAVLLAEALASAGGDPSAGPLPLYVSAGFAWEDEEQAMAARLFSRPPFAGAVGRLVPLRFDVRDVLPETHWAVRGTPPAFDTPDEDVYLEGRNIILLSKAALYTAAAFPTRSEAARIALLFGTLAGNPFPDATPQFFTAMARTLSLGLAREFVVETPFVMMRKSEVIRRGMALGVPFDLTLSCMQPARGQHCGRCSKCRERRDAFREAGVEDPASYRETPLR